ncbi:MAG: hypothetical protein HY289_13300 [Planctomycetes bacterium]|nr:hypothetical protein [Planctomycetota bacterium]
MTVGLRCLILALAMLTLAAPALCAQEPAIAAKPAVSAPRPLLDRIAEFFRYPIVNVALVAVGLIGLIFEFKLPGTTFPGSVAAICFVLFFWAHSFVGEFTLLAIMLFLLGLVFLGVEVFVVPGLGFVGVAGAVLMFLSLLLVTLEHWPTNPNEWADLGGTFGALAIGIALAVVGAVGLTWSLPSIPFLNKMVLKPPGEEADAGPSTSLSNSGTLALLGAIGVAITPLRPAGKAQFSGQFLDVMTDGDFVSPGGRVQVVEVEGTRVIVKEV